MESPASDAEHESSKTSELYRLTGWPAPGVPTWSPNDLPRFSLTTAGNSVTQVAHTFGIAASPLVRCASAGAAG